MVKRVRRKNRRLLGALSAVAIALSVYAALSSMNFNPGWGVLALALGAGALAFVATDIGVVIAVVALAMPIMAANAILGLVFLGAGLAGAHYLSSGDGRIYMVVAGGIAGAAFGPGWAAAALAGYVVGAGEGALIAGMACVLAELLGLLIGRPALAATFTGGSDATRLLDFSATKVPETLFAGAWIKDAFSGLGTHSLDALLAGFGGASGVAALVVQPLLWAAAAIVAGLAGRWARRNHKQIVGLAGATLASLVPAVGAVVFLPTLGVTGLTAGSVGVAAAGSVLVTAVCAFVWDRFFPLEYIQEAGRPSTSSMAAEDADVDELLRLIATAEERLTTEHTTQKVIMITDMKSFSKMTEEDGSVLTAKAIQKHRDLLLPIIQKYGGHGKSTGGDGLVAAFETPKEALAAAAEMQSLLDAQNASHPHEREMTVRIGIADGEIVLDKGGRPFLGNALNLAARVMNLADGGQAFVTATVAARAEGAAKTAPLGAFELKNIAKPVDIVEILWAPDQEPRDPRTREP